MSVLVIAGATGNVGSVTASQLLARGERIRVLVRDADKGAPWRKRGSEVAVGSLGDRGFLTKTLRDASAFFTLLPPDNPGSDFYGAQRRMADSIAASVRVSGVPRVVMISSLGAELEDGTGPIRGLHHFENALRATGARVAAIRAAYFQENLAGVLPAAIHGGIYPNFLPSAETAIPTIATRDVGTLGAELMVGGNGASETVDLVGPTYSVMELCEKLAAALGKPLQIVNIPAAAHVATLLEAGLPQRLAEVYAELYGALGSGLIRPVGDRLVTGTTPIDELLPGLIASAEEATA